MRVANVGECHLVLPCAVDEDVIAADGDVKTAVDLQSRVEEGRDVAQNELVAVDGGSLADAEIEVRKRRELELQHANILRDESQEHAARLKQAHDQYLLALRAEAWCVKTETKEQMLTQMDCLAHAHISELHDTQRTLSERLCQIDSAEPGMVSVLALGQERSPKPVFGNVELSRANGIFTGTTGLHLEYIAHLKSRLVDEAAASQCCHHAHPRTLEGRRAELQRCICNLVSPWRSHLRLFDAQSSSNDGVGTDRHEPRDHSSVMDLDHDDVRLPS